MTFSLCLCQVGREVFNECLMGRLADKTRVLVTNQLQYVSHADKIYYMEDGHITESGSFKQLMDQGGSFASLLKQAEASAWYMALPCWFVKIKLQGLGNSAKRRAGH